MHTTARLVLRAAAVPLSTSSTTGGGNTPVWPPPRSKVRSHQADCRLKIGGQSYAYLPRPPIPATTNKRKVARMYEDADDDFNCHDPERRAAAAQRRQEQQWAAAQEGEYLDDHHYVPGGGAGSTTSLSPHHEGYEEEAGRRQRQRLELYKVCRCLGRWW